MTAPALDHGVLQGLRDQLRNDRFVDELLDMYLGELPNRLAAIRSSVQASDAAGIAESAHSLKSPSAMLGARNLAGLCERLELIGRHGPLEAAAGVCADLVAEAARVVDMSGSVRTGGQGQ